MLVLPRWLRDRAGDDLRTTFDDRQRNARIDAGSRGVFGAWAVEITGLLLTALRARLPDGWAASTKPHGSPSRKPEPPLYMENVVQDLRFALRTFSRRPGMAVLAVVTLALGIGASSAMFSVVDSVLLQPLPFDDPDELVSIYPTNSELIGHPTLGEFALHGTFSWPEFWSFRERQTAFEDVAAYTWGTPTVFEDGRPRRILAGATNYELFSLLRVVPEVGRIFTPEDDNAGDDRIVILTHAYWQSRFGGDPGIMGQVVRMNDVPFEVVGVLPESFAIAGFEVEVWTPRTGDPTVGNWGNHNIPGVIGRLAEGVTLERGSDDVARVFASFADLGANSDHGHGGVVYARLADKTRNLRPALVALISGAFLLLVVGCGNVATLLLGAGIEREQELAVRGSLGATRGRITRQLLTESSLLALVGAVGGVVLAGVITRSLVLLAPPGIERIGDAAINGRMLGFTAGISMISGIFFGLVPAWGLSRTELGRSVSSRKGVSGGKARIQSLVVIGELTFATVLLVSGALFGRTLIALNTIDPGFEAESLLSVRLSVPFARFREDGVLDQAALDSYFQGLVEGVGALPGVEDVAVTSNLALSGDRSNNNVSPVDWPDDEDQPIAERRFVSHNFFQVAGIRIIDGRSFNASDDDLRPDDGVADPGDEVEGPEEGVIGTMIISKGLADVMFPGERAIGRRVNYWDRQATVVGVAADVRDESLDAATELAYYVPARQDGLQVGSILIRAQGAPEPLIAPVRERIWSIDPSIPITGIRPLSDLVSASVSQQRYRARLMGVFALLAGLFAVMGIYGVTARSVGSRTRELAVRMALGAERAEVRSMVLAQGLHLAIAGAVLGIGLSVVMGRLLEGLLFEVSSTDPVTLVGIAVLVGLASVLASLPPSRQATRVDPMVTLRTE